MTLPSPTTAGGTGTAVTLTAAGTAGDTANVGGLVSFNSPTSFTATASAAGILAGGATTLSSGLSSVGSIDVTTLTNGIPTGANSALQVIDSALKNIDSSRASLGALQNRFQQTINNLMGATGLLVLYYVRRVRSRLAHRMVLLLLAVGGLVMKQQL